jgi:hypothetical protein
MSGLTLSRSGDGVEAGLLFELIQKVAEKVSPFFGQGAPCFRLHCALQSEEFGEEMIDAVVGVIGRAGLAEGIVGVHERGAHVAAEHETTAQADGAEGIDTIGVLEDLCFEGSWGDLR